MKPKILIIEDDEHYIEFLRLVLDDFDITEFDKANTVEEANAAIDANQYDLVFADIRLPEGYEGMDLIKSIHAKDKSIHIIAISALFDEEYRVMGLEKGADDYISKSAPFGELKNKIRIQIQRTQEKLDLKAAQISVTWHDITLLNSGKILSPNLDPGVELWVKGLEKLVLEFLMKHPGQVFQTKELKDEYWADYDDATGIKDVYNVIKRIKEKFSKNHLECPIHSHDGGGYVVP